MASWRGCREIGNKHPPGHVIKKLEIPNQVLWNEAFDHSALKNFKEQQSSLQGH